MGDPGDHRFSRIGHWRSVGPHQTSSSHLKDFMGCFSPPDPQNTCRVRLRVPENLISQPEIHGFTYKCLFQLLKLRICSFRRTWGGGHSSHFTGFTRGGGGVGGPGKTSNKPRKRETEDRGQRTEDRGQRTEQANAEHRTPNSAGRYHAHARDRPSDCGFADCGMWEPPECGERPGMLDSGHRTNKRPNRTWAIIRAPMVAGDFSCRLHRHRLQQLFRLGSCQLSLQFPIQLKCILWRTKLISVWCYFA